MEAHDKVDVKFKFSSTCCHGTTTVFEKWIPHTQILLRGQRELTLGASGTQAVPRVALPGARKTSKGELSEREPMGEHMENVIGNVSGNARCEHACTWPDCRVIEKGSAFEPKMHSFRQPSHKLEVGGSC